MSVGCGCVYGEVAQWKMLEKERKMKGTTEREKGRRKEKALINWVKEKKWMKNKQTNKQTKKMIVLFKRKHVQKMWRSWEKPRKVCKIFEGQFILFFGHFFLLFLLVCHVILYVMWFRVCHVTLTWSKLIEFFFGQSGDGVYFFFKAVVSLKKKKKYSGFILWQKYTHMNKSFTQKINFLLSYLFKENSMCMNEVTVLCVCIFGNKESANYLWKRGMKVFEGIQPLYKVKITVYL